MKNDSKLVQKEHNILQKMFQNVYEMYVCLGQSFLDLNIASGCFSKVVQISCSGLYYPLVFIVGIVCILHSQGSLFSVSRQKIG